EPRLIGSGDPTLPRLDRLVLDHFGTSKSTGDGAQPKNAQPWPHEATLVPIRNPFTLALSDLEATLAWNVHRASSGAVRPILNEQSTMNSCSTPMHWAHRVMTSSSVCPPIWQSGSRAAIMPSPSSALRSHITAVAVGFEMRARQRSQSGDQHHEDSTCCIGSSQQRLLSRDQRLYSPPTAGCIKSVSTVPPPLVR